MPSPATLPEHTPTPALSASLQRIGGMVLRYLYLLKNSWPRFIEALFWPFLNLIMWGLLSKFLSETTQSIALPFSFLIGAAILWEIVLRGSMATMMPLLEEVWSRTLGNLFISPLRPYEFVLGLMTISIIRLVTALIPCVIIAWMFFDYRVWDLGAPLIFFVANLIITGWWMGLMVSCLLVRYGQAVEWIMWMVVFIIQPFVCVFYPLETLPAFLHPISLALPPTHVFEGMRDILLNQQVNATHMLAAFGLNIVYLAAAIAFFLRSLYVTRRGQGLFSYAE